MYPLENFPFEVAHYSFVYLGVHVKHKFENLYKANFAPLLAQIQKDFERWSLLNLSLLASVNCVKTNILPRLYLFQCIPLFLPQSFFHKLFQNFSGIRRVLGCANNICKDRSHREGWPCQILGSIIGLPISGFLNTGFSMILLNLPWHGWL